MRLFQVQTFAIARQEAPGALARRVMSAVEAAGGDPSPRFFFEDGAFGGVSGVARAVKRFPELALFVRAGVPLAPGGAPGGSALTNFGPEWSGGHTSEPAGAVSAETVAALFDGIPRAYPFHHVTAMWPVDVLRAGGSGEPVQWMPGGRMDARFGFGVLRPSVILKSDWWINGRLNGLVAHVEYDPPAPGGTPVVPDALREFLAQLGKVKTAVFIPVSEPAEATEARNRSLALREIMQRFRGQMGQAIQALDLPHHLPPRNAISVPPDEKIGSMRDVIADVFDRLGYAYQSRRHTQGSYVVGKTTPRNSTLSVTIDVGTWSRQCSAQFAIEGLGSRATLSLAVTGRPADLQYSILSLEQFRQMMENLAAIVSYVERTLVPEVEAAALETPAWAQPSR